MNMSYKSGQREHQLADGTIVKEMADGHKIMQSGPGITHSVGAKSMHMSTSNSAQDHQSLSNEESLLASRQHEYDTTKQTMQRQATEFVNRLAAGEASGEHYSYNHATGAGKTLIQEVANSKDLHDRHEYNNNQATEVAIKGNVSGSLSKGGSGHSGQDSAPQSLFGQAIGAVGGAIGLDLSASGRADSTNTQSLGENQGASTRVNITTQTEDIARAAKDMQFNETQTHEKALAESLTGSYEHMEQLREQITVSKQNIQRYQTSSDNTQSNNYTVTDDIYPKRLNFIAEQKDQNGFRIGEEKAKKIMESEEGGKKYDPAFQAKYLPQQRMLTHDFDRDHDKAVRENIPQNTDFKKDRAEVSEFGNSAMEASKTVTPDAKEMVERQHKSAPNKIALAEQKVLQNGEAAQRAVDKESDDRNQWFGRNKTTGKKFTEE